VDHVVLSADHAVGDGPHGGVHRTTPDGIAPLGRGVRLSAVVAPVGSGAGSITGSVTGSGAGTWSTSGTGTGSTGRGALEANKAAAAITISPSTASGPIATVSGSSP